MATPRPSWKGVIQFGLVDIAVELIPAVQERESPFVTVHAGKNHVGPVKTIKRCAACASDVDASETSKAIALDDGTYAIVTDDELTACATPSRSTIVLSHLVPLDCLPAIRLDKPYYMLAPKPSTAYDLLRECLTETRVAFVGKIAFRGNESPAAIFVDDGQLMLFTLRWPADIRRAPDSETSSTCITPELKNEAYTLMKAGLFGPAYLSTLTDDYQAALDALIRVKRGRSAPADLPLETALKRSAAKAQRTRRKVAAA